MSLFKNLAKKLKIPLPKGLEKYGTGLKVGATLLGIPGVSQSASLDPAVLGARGSTKELGRSVDQAKDKSLLEANIASDAQQKAAAAAAAAAEEPFTKSKESQLQALKRKGRRSSILTSSQGAADPLGIPG